MHVPNVEMLGHHSTKWEGFHSRFRSSLICINFSKIHASRLCVISKGGRVPVEPSRPAFPRSSLCLRVPVRSFFFSVPKFAFPRSRVPGQNNFPSTVKKKVVVFSVVNFYVKRN